MEKKADILSILALIFAILIPPVGFILALVVVFSKRPKKGLGIAAIVVSVVWGFLLLPIIGALAYFGALSPDNFLPEKCVMGAGFGCIDMYSEGDTITVRIQSTTGFDITDMTVSIEEECSPLGVTLVNGASQEFSCPVTKAPKYQGEIKVIYTNSETQYRHSSEGKLLVKMD